MNVYTFWEGKKPDYIKLCQQTWKKLDYNIIELNYDNISQYTDLISRFTLPQQADFIRVHVLRDNGGYWLDADTIIFGNKLPETNKSVMLLGNKSIGLLYSKPHSEMFTEWARYQDTVANVIADTSNWSIMGNSFLDHYLRFYDDYELIPYEQYFPELNNLRKSHYAKYNDFYFNSNQTIIPSDLIMLHNSWTPDWYSKLTADEIQHNTLTMSNLVRDKYALSVIIPLYNTAEYLTPLLNNLIYQRDTYYPETEIIVVDDGSTDNPMIPDSILYYKIPHSGVSVARNFGIDHSTGRYITFIDSDDNVTDDYLHTVYTNMRSDPKPDYCVYDWWYQHGDYYYNTAHGENAPFLWSWGVPMYSFTRELIADHRFKPELQFGEDIDFLKRVLNENLNRKEVRHPIYKYRTDRENSLCHKHRRGEI